MRPWIARKLEWIGATLFVVALLMGFAFPYTGARSPDPSTGRMIPIQDHGTIYVTLFWGGLFYVCLISGFVTIAIGLYNGLRKR